MPTLTDLAETNQQVISSAISRSRKTNSEEAKLRIVLSAIDKIHLKLSDVFVSNLPESTTIKNLDEVKLHLRTELRTAVKPLIDELKAQNISREKFQAKLNTRNVIVDNLADIKSPDNIKINNLSELQAFFDNLASVFKESLNITIDPPQVNVDAPQVNIPETVVNVPEMDMPEVDLKPLLKALDPLKFISDRANKPIAVRVSNGNKFEEAIRQVSKAQDKIATAFSNVTGLTAKEFRSSSRALSQKSSATNTKVTVGATSTAVVSANTDRISLTLVNDSDEVIYVSKSGTAVANEGIRLNSAGGSASFGDYTGAVTAICSSGSKNLTVCEV